MKQKFNLYSMDSELTNRCNSACPLCPRTGTFPGGVSKAIHESGWLDISLDHIDNICQHTNLKKFSYCGNYGDPVVHPKAFDIFKRVSENGIKRQRIHTNGSIRSEAWWKELGSLDGDISVVFGLDGLKDTLPIYRVNCDFDKVIANAKAFIAAGGIAEWQFIVFEHNEHQVEEAEKLAYDLGFHKFFYKITSRHFSKNSDKTTKTYRKSSKSDIEIKTIGAPNNKKFKAEVIDSGVVTHDVICAAKETEKMFVTPEGYVIPCCHVHGDLNLEDYNLKKAFRLFGIDNNFARFLDNHDVKYELSKYSIDEIMSSYNKNIEFLYDYWKRRQFFTCNRQCGSNQKNIEVRK